MTDYNASLVPLFFCKGTARAIFRGGFCFGPAAVIAARDRQIERFKSEKKTYANAQMMPKMIRKHCSISAEGEKLLENAITRLGLSARAYDRILKVARTIADLDGGSNIEPRHLSEAIQYRTLDRSYWA